MHSMRRCGENEAAVRQTNLIEKRFSLGQKKASHEARPKSHPYDYSKTNE